jgi:PAS domain S-box-containing protein
LEAIVSSIPAGVVVVEKEGGKIVYVNDRAITLYGCDPSGLDLLNYSTRMMRLLTLDGQTYSPEQLPVSKALSTGQEVKDELIIERPDKSRIIVAVSAKPVKDEKGQIVAAVGIFEDITDYKNAEGVLRANEQRWTTTLASIGDAVIATDEKGSITFMNKVAEKLTGYSFQEAMQKSLKEVFHIVNEHNGQEVLSPVDRVFREGAAVALVNHTMLIRKDGTQVPIADSGAPIKDSSGKTTGVVLVFHDISDRRLAEKTLKQSEERYRTLFSNMDEAFALHEMIFDSQGIPVDYRFLEVNEAFERLTGFKESQIVGKTAREVMPSVEPFWIETYGKVVTTGEPVRFERYDQNTNKHYEVHAFRPVEGRCAVLFNDITERKQLQQRLEDYTKNLERVVKERTTQVSKERKRLLTCLRHFQPT